MSYVYNYGEKINWSTYEKESYGKGTNLTHQQQQKHTQFFTEWEWELSDDFIYNLFDADFREIYTHTIPNCNIVYFIEMSRFVFVQT